MRVGEGVGWETDSRATEVTFSSRRRQTCLRCWPCRSFQPLTVTHLEENSPSREQRVVLGRPGRQAPPLGSEAQ